MNLRINLKSIANPLRTVSHSWCGFDLEFLHLQMSIWQFVCEKIMNNILTVQFILFNDVMLNPARLKEQKEQAHIKYLHTLFTGWGIVRLKLHNFIICTTVNLFPFLQKYFSFTHPTHGGTYCMQKQSRQRIS